jgi:hypothetical protein
VFCDPTIGGSAVTRESIEWAFVATGEGDGCTVAVARSPEIGRYDCGVLVNSVYRAKGKGKEDGKKEEGVIPLFGTESGRVTLVVAGSEAPPTLLGCPASRRRTHTSKADPSTLGDPLCGACAATRHEQDTIGQVTLDRSSSQATEREQSATRPRTEPLRGHPIVEDAEMTPQTSC